MSTASISSSSSSSSSSNNSPGHVIHFHNRRSSAPSVVDRFTTSSITASSTGNPENQRILNITATSYPPLPLLPSTQKLSSNSSSLVNSSEIPTPNDVSFTIPNHYVYAGCSSSTETIRMPATQSHSGFLEVPSRLTRSRSNSVPINLSAILHEIPGERTDTTLTSSSSSSSSDVSDVGKSFTYRLNEPKETKQEGRRSPKSRDTTSLSFKNIQKAEKYISTQKPKNYLQKAITLYNQVVQMENWSPTPWVQPYFRLVTLLETPDHVNHYQIIHILDSVIEGRFDEWIKIDAIMQKALACLELAQFRVEALTSIEDETCKIIYLKYIHTLISKMKKKKTIDRHITYV